MSKQHEKIDGCKDKCGSCNFCCLFVCKHCWLYEGSLTTHCPDRLVSIEDSDKIYLGELNYRGNRWIFNEISEHSPVFFPTHKELDEVEE